MKLKPCEQVRELGALQAAVWPLYLADSSQIEPVSLGTAGLQRFVTTVNTWHQSSSDYLAPWEAIPCNPARSGTVGLDLWQGVWGCSGWGILKATGKALGEHLGHCEARVASKWCGIAESLRKAVMGEQPVGQRGTWKHNCWSWVTLDMLQQAGGVLRLG